MRLLANGRNAAFSQAGKSIINSIALANTNTIRRTAGKMMGAARNNIAAGGLGEEWQKSILFSTKPKKGRIALDPQAWLHSTLNFASVFETGKTFGPLKKHWLWLPLPTVPLYPKTGRGRFPLRQMDPAKYIKDVGPLKFAAHREGKTPILLGLINTTPLARSWLWARKPKRGGLGSKAKGATPQWVPMFVGVNQVTIKKRFNIVPAMLQAQKSMPEIYNKALEEAKQSYNIQNG